MSDKLAAPATSLVKALDVLLALEDSPAGRGVTDIARALGLPKSAVHRLLVTFQACGFVQQQPETSRYSLGPVLARLGLRAADLFTPRRVARPYMEALTREEGAAFYDAYAKLLAEAYPTRADGITLFPFRRLFIVARRA